MDLAEVARLLDAGYAVTVRQPCGPAAAGIKGLSFANDVPRSPRKRIILGSLPTPDVARGHDRPRRIIKGGKARIFIDLSTTGPRLRRSCCRTRPISRSSMPGVSGGRWRYQRHLP
jgi:hypothetical protein